MLSAFIEKADCETEYNGVDTSETELMDIFQRLRAVKDRVNTRDLEPSAYDDIKRVASVFMY